MSYPKWRHHPTKESMIVWDWGIEESQTPDADGWRDDHNFAPLDPAMLEDLPHVTPAVNEIQVETAPKRGGWPKGTPRKAKP